MKVHIGTENIDLSWMKINPGETVVLKPNFVKESVYGNEESWEHVITSRKVIEIVSEYVGSKLNGSGKIIVCDAPQTDSSFDKIIKLVGLEEIAQKIRKKHKIEFEILDMRDFEWVSEQEVIVERKDLKGDPSGKVAFNLGRQSLFYGHSGEGKYYGADYDQGAINKHHRGETQEYLISMTPIIADVFINLPKLKTHKKTGVTLSLKNLVGINADKNWLPHHTDGSPENGGDQYPSLTLQKKIESFLTKSMRYFALKVPFLGKVIAKKMRSTGEKIFGDGSTVIRSGNWYGNDTTWRMVLDLNRCLLYGDRNGNISENRKRYYTVIDGIVGMEGNGPMHGTPKDCGVIIAGEDPVATDAVAATLMGYDWKKIPVIKEAFSMKELPITETDPYSIEIKSDVPGLAGSLKDLQKKRHFNFEPHFGWKNHIELNET